MSRLGALAFVASALGGAAIASGAVTGCRGIIGVEDLALADGGDASTAESGTTDGGSVDASVTETGPVSECATKSECRQCCKQENPAGSPKLEKAAQSCICGDGGACPTQCATSTCLATPSPPEGSCAPCFDNAILQAGCADERDTCERDSPECHTLIACLKSCPTP